jgi:FADH2-dependent halogenase
MGSSQSESCDVVVVGCGPGGSITAASLAEKGLHVVAIEKSSFPRYHIGESLTGTAGDVIRNLGLEADMERLDFPVKTGVKVVGRDAASEFFVPVLRPTWQVRRAEFDDLLLKHSLSRGIDLRQGMVRGFLQDGDRLNGVRYTPVGSDSADEVELRCKAVIDASGHSAVLSRHKIAGPRRVENFGRQIAVFTRFDNVERDPGEMGNNTFIFYGAPLHWAWFIPLSSNSVSIGVVMPTTTYKRYGNSPEEVMAWGLRNINPDLARRVEGVEAAEEVRTIANYSYSIEPFVGEGWACVGDAHRFLDPIFSFGVAFAMVEGYAAADAISEGLRANAFADPLDRYRRFSNRGQSAAGDVVRYFWRFPAFFSFQTRGKTRQDMIRLLAGDCFGEEPIDALSAMRKSLHNAPVDGLEDTKARDIAKRVFVRYSYFQGIDAAYISVTGDGICVSFVMNERAEDLYESLYDFEEGLYSEFGRDALAVMKWVDSEEFRDDIPPFDDAHVIFDRRKQ